MYFQTDSDVSLLMSRGSFHLARIFAQTNNNNIDFICIEEAESALNELSKWSLWSHPLRRCAVWREISRVFDQSHSRSLVVAQYFHEMSKKSRVLNVEISSFEKETLIELSLDWYRRHVAASTSTNQQDFIQVCSITQFRCISL